MTCESVGSSHVLREFVVEVGSQSRWNAFIGDALKREFEGPEEPWMFSDRAINRLL